MIVSRVDRFDNCLWSLESGVLSVCTWYGIWYAYTLHPQRHLNAVVQTGCGFTDAPGRGDTDVDIGTDTDTDTDTAPCCASLLSFRQHTFERPHKPVRVTGPGSAWIRISLRRTTLVHSRCRWAAQGSKSSLHHNHITIITANYH